MTLGLTLPLRPMDIALLMGDRAFPRGKKGWVTERIIRATAGTPITMRALIVADQAGNDAPRLFRDAREWIEARGFVVAERKHENNGNKPYMEFWTERPI